MSCFVRAAASLASLALAMQVAAAPPLRVDGEFSDWHGVAPLPAAAGGASGAFNVTTVRARSLGTRLFLRFDTGVVRNLQAGSGADGTLLLEIRRTQPTTQTALTIDFRARALWADGNPGNTVTWLASGLGIQPTFAASEYELEVDLATVGIAQGDQIAITFGDGSPSEDAAFFTLSDPPGSEPTRSYERPAGTRLRVASLNTLQTGLFDSQQDDELARLIDAVDADVYCFQEEYSSSAGQIASLLNSIDPLGGGETWIVHKNNDCVVASHYTPEPLPSFTSRDAGAGIDTGDGRRVIVVTNHPKCCGYIGNSDDADRISQMQSLIDALTSVRNETAGASLVPFADAPAIVIGDWNLVGSRTPLTMLEDPAGANMRDVLVAPLVGRAFTTWRGGSTGPGSFMPGRLDLLAVERDSLAVCNAFVLDTGLLGAGDLAALGLQAGDSGASDHLMLVVDLGFPDDLCPGDADGDGDVDVFDFNLFAASFGISSGATRLEGDFDSNGTIDVFDFNELAAAFGQACP